ncbi:transcription initiation factor IIB family protein [Salinigranum salinum]|uniref:transcription initiation factor IIB family protein n=1 Tax=Salinigranum salinum TaxID=1364937 RepID=UPI001863F407|nr:transcription initiation factor IIB family protein [Salinigranum salinum]
MSDFDFVEGVCTACGFVIRQEGVEEALSQLRESQAMSADNPRDSEEWTDVFKVRNSTEQRVATALEILEQIGNQFDLSSDVRLQVASLYGQVARDRLNDGRHTEDVVGALVCIATRQAGEPLPISLVAHRMNRDSRDIGRLTKRLKRELNLENADCLPESYIEPLCKSLECTPTTVERARELVQSARSEGLVAGRNPVGVASAAIYAVESGERTQREIAEAAGVSRETIRVRLQEFRQGGVIDV